MLLSGRSIVPRGRRRSKRRAAAEDGARVRHRRAGRIVLGLGDYIAVHI
jgi:hypothetical protein